MPPSRSRHSILPATTFGTIQREYSPDVADAVHPVQKSSRRVRYLRATVEDSNFCKALLLHDFRNRGARIVTKRVWHGEVGGFFDLTGGTAQFFDRTE